MKKFLLVLLVVLWPITANASLISYDFSFTVLAQNLSLPLFGDILVGVHFIQDTEGDPFSQHTLSPTWYSVQGNQRGADFSNGLQAISPTDVAFFAGDPGGNVFLHLLYDTPLGLLPLASPLPEPDRLATSFGAEMGTPPSFPCNVPDSPPCPIGTGGAQTFARGEFSFVSTAVAEPPTMVLIACGFLLIGILKFRYSFLTAAVL